jgi:diketogulonate reductase-like aldo/keto reductase
MEIPNITLSNKVNIPQIGLGTWLIKKESECKNAVKTALDFGYRHIDTAQIYGNEQFVGQAMIESNVKREDIFVTTKIFNDKMWWEDVVPSFEESLKKLKTDYVDLLLLHFPVTELRRPAWHRMEEIYKSGKTRSIGVSNYTIKHLEQPELVKYCKKNNIIVEAYSPLTHGHNLSDKVITEIGKKYNKSVAQVMIRWCFQMDFVVLPKSSNPKHIKENLDVFDFKLDQKELKRIQKLDRNFRTCWDPTHVA